MKNTQKIFLLVTLLAICIGFAGPTFVQAQEASEPYKVLAPLPCINAYGVECPGGETALQKEVDFKTYIQFFINVVIGLSAVFAVLMIVYGGFLYMTTEAFTGKSDAKNKITNAIYGLLLVLSSYLILKTIDPRLVEIPTTLVPKIMIKVPVTDLMETNERDLAEFRDRSNQIAAQRQEIKNQISELQSQVSEIDKKIAATNDLAEKSKLEAQRDRLITQINTLESDKILSDATNELNAIIRDTSSIINNAIDPNVDNGYRLEKSMSSYITGIFLKPEEKDLTVPELLDKKISDIPFIRDKYEGRLKAFGQYDMTKLKDQAYFVEFTLKLQKAAVLNMTSDKDKAPVIILQVQTSLDLISDPDLKSNLAQRIATLK